MVVDEEADVNDGVDVIKVVPDGDAINVAAGVGDETDVDVGVDMIALGTDGVVVIDVVVGGPVVVGVAVVLEEANIEAEPPTVAATLTPFLSSQQVVLVLPQHQLPSLHCLSPMLPDTPCQCVQAVSLRCLFPREKQDSPNRQNTDHARVAETFQTQWTIPRRIRTRLPPKHGVRVSPPSLA